MVELSEQSDAINGILSFKRNKKKRKAPLEPGQRVTDEPLEDDTEWEVLDLQQLLPKPEPEPQRIEPGERQEFSI